MQQKRIFLFSILSLCLILSIASVSAFSFSNWFGKITGKVVSEDQSPMGVTDGVFNGAVSGWARDPDYQSTGQYIEVQFYIDNEYAGSTTANLASETEVGGNGNHRFSWVIPDKYYDGKQHEVWGYAIGKLSDGSSSNSNVQLGSPSYQSRIFTFQQRFTCGLFTYSAWSDCVNGQQTRVVTVSEPAGCTGGNPITSQSCTVPTNTFNVSLSISGEEVYPSDTNYKIVQITLGQPIIFNSTAFGKGLDFHTVEYITENGFVYGGDSWKPLISWNPSSGKSRNDTYFFPSPPSPTRFLVRAATGNSTSEYSYSKMIIVEVKNKTISASTCIDSDGGINYSVRGFVEVKDSQGNTIAADWDDCDEEEFFCNPNGSVGVIEGNWNCSFGCSNGACLKEPSSVCSSLINKVSNPSDFELYGQKYTFNWNYSHSSYWWVDGVDEKYTSNSATWQTSYDSDGDGNSEYFYLNYNLHVFDNKNIDLTSIITDTLSYSICSIQSFWTEDNKETKILVCNYDPTDMYNSIDSYAYNSQNLYWIKDNILVSASVQSSTYLNDDEFTKVSRKKTQEILSSFADNDFKQPDWSKFYVQYPVSNVIAEDLVSCPSEVKMTRQDTNETCQPSWECKLEPAICPPHGYQTRICQDYSCDQKREEKVSCSPGMCSGCMIPRWFGDKYSDNVCMPYGARFAAESGYSMKLVENSDSETLSESSYGEINLTVISNTQAILTIIGEEQFFTYNLTIGQETDITEGLMSIENGGDGLISISVSPTKIYYNPNGNDDYVQVDVNYLSNQKVVDTFNAYCDYDGNVKAQKSKDYNGDWAKCQNNHECESNLCSNGECIDTKSAIQQSNKLKSVVSSILCRISSALTSETYDECMSSLE